MPKQDDRTLEDVTAFVDDLLRYRRTDVSEHELPDTAEQVEADDGGQGTLVREHVWCGKDGCSCTSGNQGDMHGPYLYRYYREGGSLKSEYEGKPSGD